MAKLNSQKIRIATYDVNGLLYPVKRSKILSKLKKDKIDIELLQETHLMEIEHGKLKRTGFRRVFILIYSVGQ